MGYTVGCSVARLMQSLQTYWCPSNGSVKPRPLLSSVRPWGNRLKDLKVSRAIHYITYVQGALRLCFTDVFTRRIRGWQVSQHLRQKVTTGTTSKLPEIHHSDQGVQYLSDAYVDRHHVISGPSRMPLGRTGSRKTENPQVTLKTSMKREIVLDILSNKCITKNAPIRR